MKIQYPDLFEKRLSTSKKMRAAVDGTITTFDSWLRDSKLPFFTDYTDHGSEHLNHVMLTAAALIPEEAKAKFTAEDAAVLILAILLHDSALHLSEAGFYSLIKGKAAKNRIDGIDKIAWPELWDEFLFSARRWDDQKLKEVFGVDETGASLGIVRDPFDFYTNLADTDRKLIGEFIRRHHPRLAHEFAVFGVPGPSAELIKPASEFDASLCNMAGLVARSHGRPIRSCVDYLFWKQYPICEFQNVHAVYLMALLRVADFLHVDATRTTNVVFRYKHIPSIFSEREHKALLAVKSITRATADPEAIHVTAQPEDVHTFLRLKNWLAGIQAELDQSWAALGEVYGRYTAEGLNNLGLSLRRIKSNLDDVESFANGVSYVPQHITLDVARADLLKLLIGPLYGNDPGIGVRELMQNAVDAVRELTEFRLHHPAYTNVVTIQQKDDVEINLEAPDAKGHAWLTITDKGIGMTEEVIHNYFLKAGASFRTADAWKKEFEIDGTIEKPAIKSRVLRSGRFGVGALAAFLLGGEIHVSTRHVMAAKGIKFITRLDLDPVELRYDDSIPVGTSIRVKLSPQAFNKFDDSDISVRASWDWFCLDQPTVLRKVYGKNIVQRFIIEHQDLQPRSAWRKINPIDYESVYWSYEPSPALVCNGIRVGSNYSSGNLWKDTTSRMPVPSVCVFDPDGMLPLDLQREQLSVEKYPFADLLLEDVSRDILAFLLVNTPEIGSLQEIKRMPKHQGFSMIDEAAREVNLQPWIVTDEGICLCTTWNVWRLQFKRLLLATNYNHRQPEFAALGVMPQTISTQTACLMFDLSGNAKSKQRFFTEWVRGISGKPLFAGCQIQGTRLITDASYAKEFVEKSYSPYKSLNKQLAGRKQFGKWHFLEERDCPDTMFSTAAFAADATKDHEYYPPLCVEHFSSKQNHEPEPNTIERLWKEIIDYPVIPFDLASRRSKLAKAYKILEPYIEAHKSDKAKVGKKDPLESDQME